MEINFKWKYYNCSEFVGKTFVKSERKPQQPLGEGVKWGPIAKSKAWFGVLSLPCVEIGLLTLYGSELALGLASLLVVALCYCSVFPFP